MQEPDLSNPLVVISSFFAILLGTVAFLVRLLPAVLGGSGIILGLGTLVGGMFVWFKVLMGD
jgi:hypothetical protein